MPTQNHIHEFGQRLLPESVWENIVPDVNGCWIWIGYTATNGYGHIGRRLAGGKKTVKLAHRVVYEALSGKIPGKLSIDHLCRVRCCVNPGHLEPVTTRENVLRGVGITAANAKKTHCNKGHAFTSENTSIVLDDYGYSRSCKACRSDIVRRYRSTDAAKRRRLERSQNPKEREASTVRFEQLRSSALSKLTAQERAALGLE